MRHSDFNIATDFEAEDAGVLSNFDGDWDETGADDEFNYGGDLDDADEYEEFSEFDDDDDDIDSFFGKRRRRKRKSMKSPRRNTAVRARQSAQRKPDQQSTEEPMAAISMGSSTGAMKRKLVADESSRIRGKRPRKGMGAAIASRLRNMKVIKMLFKRNQISKPQAAKLMDRIDARYGDIGDTRNFSGDEYEQFFGKKAKARRALRSQLKSEGHSAKDARKMARDEQGPSKIGNALKEKFQQAKSALIASGEVTETPVSTYDAAPPIMPPSDDSADEGPMIPLWVWITGGVVVAGTAAFLIFRR